MKFANLFALGALLGSAIADFIPSRVYINEPALTAQLGPQLFQNLKSAGVTTVLVTFVDVQGSSVVAGDISKAWEGLSASTRASIKETGIKFLLSLGGEAGKGWITADPTTAAASLVKYANDFGYDGIDLDLEGGSLAQTIGQMVDISKAMKAQGAKYVTVAPQVGHFETGAAPSLACSLFSGGAGIIDEVYIQYYNDPDKMRDNQSGKNPSVDSILRTNHMGEVNPMRGDTNTAMKQIIAKCGVDGITRAPKIAIGRPYLPLDAGAETARVEPRELYCAAAKEFGQYFSGLFFWSYRSNTDFNAFKDAMDLKGQCSAAAPGQDTQIPVVVTQAPYVVTQAPYVVTQTPFVGVPVVTVAPVVEEPITQAPIVQVTLPYIPETGAIQTFAPVAPVVAVAPVTPGDSKFFAADCNKLEAYSCSAKTRGDASWHQICKQMCDFGAQPMRCPMQGFAGYMDCVKKLHADMKCVYGQTCQAGGYSE